MTKTLFIYVFREQVQFQEVLQIHYWFSQNPVWLRKCDALWRKSFFQKRITNNRS